MKKVSIRSSLKNRILTGLLVTAPIVITVFVFYVAFVKLDSVLGSFLANYVTLPGGKPIPGVGLVALVAIITGFGIITRSYAGKLFVKTIDTLFRSIPLVKVLYNSIKQAGNIIASNKLVFKKVLLVDMTETGVKGLAFLTSDSTLKTIDGKRYISVFFPSAPTPTTGFMLFVPEERTVEIEIDMESALKMVVSGGMLRPENFTLQGRKVSYETVDSRGHREQPRDPCAYNSGG